jgi:hypothetical protein
MVGPPPVAARDNRAGAGSAEAGRHAFQGCGDERMSSIKLARRAAWLLCALAAAGTAPARAAEGGTMYRCPGNDYNNTISAKEAKERGCHTIENAPVSIVQTAKPRPQAGSTPSPTGSMPTLRIDPASQKARDTDARRILGSELRTEEERLAALQKEFNNGEPERQGNERNFQKYADRVAEMKAAIARKEGDIAAIKREMAKLPQ